MTKKKQSIIIKKIVCFCLFLIIVFVVVLIFRIKNKKDKIPYIPSGTINGHEYVDLGLPSGLKWATCNVGANSPEEFGNHYTWRQQNTVTAWGASWRTPTKAELEELISKCKWRWIRKNGINGYKVIGPNGNFIFLPAAGYIGFGISSKSGDYGYYWSSTSYDTTTEYAYYLYFDRWRIGPDCILLIPINGMMPLSRSVRPVSK